MVVAQLVDKIDFSMHASGIFGSSFPNSSHRKPARGYIYIFLVFLFSLPHIFIFFLICLYMYRDRKKLVMVQKELLTTL